jgi:uncharacterized protein (TIGR03435 family)
VSTKFCIRISAGLLLAAAAFAQSPAAAPVPVPASALAFEVASVKPAGPLDPVKIMNGQMRIGMKIDKARVEIGALSLNDLIMIAYKIKSYQLQGPDWMTGERFNVQAKMPDGATEEQVPEMLQALLVERFKLTFHRDTKEHNVYALIIGKGGPKLKDSPPEDNVPVETAAGDGVKGDPPKPDGPKTAKAGPDMSGTMNGPIKMSGAPDAKGGMVMKMPGAGTTRMTMLPGPVMHMESSKMNMLQLTEMLSRFLDRPVVDLTELKGSYQIAVDLGMEDMRNAAKAAGQVLPAPPPPPGGGAGGRGGDAVAAEPGTSIFASVQQMGLRLDPRKAPIERIVVDSLEKMPTEN